LVICRDSISALTSKSLYSKIGSASRYKILISPILNNEKKSIYLYTKFKKMKRRIMKI